MKWWIIGLVVLLLGGGVLKWAVIDRHGPTYEIERVEIAKGPLVMTIETSGAVEPLRTVTVGCEVSGRIMELAVDRDGPVAKGQVICRIDPELVQRERDQGAAAVVKAEIAVADAKVAWEEQKANLPVMTMQALAKLQEAKSSLNDAQFQLSRVESMVPRGASAPAELSIRRTAFEGAQAAVTAAQASHDLSKNNERFLVERAEQAVAQAEASLALAKAQLASSDAMLERCTIRSPIDGIVLDRYMDVGATVNAAFQTPPLFLLAPQLSRMRVNAKVSESDIIHIDEGQIARFTVEGRGTHAFQGPILRKQHQPEVIQGVATYTVVFEVDNDERLTLLPGLTVNVEIECVNHPEAIKIANSALRFKPPLERDERQALLEAVQWPPQPSGSDGQKPDYCEKAHAWRFDEKAVKWMAVPLWIGITDHFETEILGGGAPGDAFIKKFKEKKAGGFSFQEMLQQSDPSNRRVL